MDNSESDIPELNSCVSSDSNDSGKKITALTEKLKPLMNFQEHTVVEKSEQWLGNDAGEEELDDGEYDDTRDIIFINDWP